MREWCRLRAGPDRVVLLCMTGHRDRWTALAAGVATLVLGVVIASVRLPFVVWSPGGLADLYSNTGGLIVSGSPTYARTGHLLTTEVAVSSQTVSLGNAMTAFFSRDKTVFPQAVSYSVGLPIAPLVIGQQAVEAQRAAEAAALRLAALPGLTARPVARVVSVLATGPSFGWLQPDDIIDAVGATTVTSVADFKAAVATHTIGDTIQLSVTRDGRTLDKQVDVVAQASYTSQQAPSLGVTMTDSYQLPVLVTNAPIDTRAGLLLAIAVYDSITSGPLLGSLTVTGIGAVDANGTVSGVAGSKQALAAAQAAGIQVFLLPASNCVNASLPGLTMRVVAVTTLEQAVSSIQILATGGDISQVPVCQS